MFKRLLEIPKDSFFLFGPRGTGKTTWLQSVFPGSLHFDLLEDALLQEFLANPGRLSDRIPSHYQGWVIIDEVQKVPSLLNEVHRLMEKRKLKFAITGSSARKLKSAGVNLLGGRALLRSFFPLTTSELGSDFKLDHALKYGHLPKTFSVDDPKDYLKAYMGTYLREEIQQERITRNLSGFSRFLEAASFSQAQIINYSAVGRDASLDRKVVQEYFEILKDLLIAFELPVFTKRAKRKLQGHPKFYFFDVGVYRAIRPRGPLDSEAEIDGPVLESLLIQEIRALNSLLGLDYNLFSWRTRGAKPIEVDLVLYGPRGLLAFEVKRSATLRSEDFKGLHLFKGDYPSSQCFMIYGGMKPYYEKDIRVIPYESCLKDLRNILSSHER